MTVIPFDRTPAAPDARIAQDVLDAVTSRLGATAEEYDRSATFPQANFDLLADLGLTGLTVSPRFGGRGAGLGEALRVLGAVAKGEPSTALILFMTYGWHAQPERTEALATDVYGQLARDAVAGTGLLGVFRVEPELGTPLRGGLPATTIRRLDSGWNLSGRKIYSTGSTGLGWYAVWVRTDEHEPRVGHVLVRAGSPGVEIVPAWDHLGMRATVSHEVVFTSVWVPDAHAIDLRPPAEWAAQPVDLASVHWNALSISTIYDGVARAARDWLARYLNERAPANLGASLATLPRVQEKFGEIEALLFTNRTMLDAAIARADLGGGPSVVEVNLVKHVVTANAIKAVQIGLELTGNPGLSRTNPLERHYRDVLCSRIHTPQDDMILLAAGKTGLSL